MVPVEVAGLFQIDTLFCPIKTKTMNIKLTQLNIAGPVESGSSESIRYRFVFENDRPTKMGTLPMIECLKFSDLLLMLFLI